MSPSFVQRWGEIWAVADAAMSGLVARSGRYARAGRGGLGCSTAGRPEPGRSRLLRPRSRPGSRRAGRRGDREVPAAGDPLPEPSDRLLAPLSRLDLAAARSQSVALARTAASPTAPAEPERRRLSRLGRQRDGGVQPTARYCARRRRARPLPERVLQARGRRVRRPSLSEHGRSCTTPSTSGTSPRRSGLRGRAGHAARGDQYQAYRLQLGLRDARARSCRRIPARSSSSPGGS